MTKISTNQKRWIERLNQTVYSHQRQLREKPINYTCTSSLCPHKKSSLLMSCNEFQPKNLTISRNLHSSLEFALLCSVVRFEPEKYQLSYHNKLDKPCIVKFVTSCSVNVQGGRKLLDRRTRWWCKNGYALCSLFVGEHRKFATSKDCNLSRWKYCRRCSGHFS